VKLADSNEGSVSSDRVRQEREIWFARDAEEADEHLSVIANMLRSRGEPPMSVTLVLEELDHTTGYAAWAKWVGKLVGSWKRERA
jgi:hypothetical protein